MCRLNGKAAVIVGAGGFALLVALATLPAAAQQQYPSKPVRMLVGMSAGGPTDAVGRIIAQSLSERFKQNFVVDNRPGANALLAIQALTASTPDGYTLMVATSGSMTMAPLLEKNLPYDPLTSFTPVALGAAYPYVVVARRDSEVNDIKGLIEYSKKNQGKVTYGSSGMFSANHLGGEWLKGLTGLVAQHIPYKGVGTITAVMAGEIDFALSNSGVAIPLIKAGKLKGLAVTGPNRLQMANDLPTMIESGVPGFVLQPWNGIVGPAHMPQEIAAQLNKTINEELQRADNQARLRALFFSSILDTPEGYKRLIAQELAHWGEVIKSLKVQK